MKIDDTTEILKIKILDIKTGNEWLLYERPGKKQHFRDAFQFENYNIQLRLDWSDMSDITNEPTLDADIWIEDENNEKVFVKKEKEMWHHTKKELDKETGLYVYKFKFNNLELTLQPTKTIAQTISGTARIC